MTVRANKPAINLREELASLRERQGLPGQFRFPNKTTTQKNEMDNVAGIVVFDTTLGKLCVNTGAGWETITST